jgi:hypothetical protein
VEEAKKESDPSAAIVDAAVVPPPVEQKTQEEARLLPWQILVELRDHTGFADWSDNTDGWDTLEEHRDPSQCAGVTMDDDDAKEWNYVSRRFETEDGLPYTSVNGEITEIELSDSNLAGGKPPHLTFCLATTTS